MNSTPPTVLRCTLIYVHSSIAIILMGKRKLIALLNLSSWCLVMVERLFLAVPWGCLQFVIVVFPDHTHLLFFSLNILKPLHVFFCQCLKICITFCCNPQIIFVTFFTVRKWSSWGLKHLDTVYLVKATPPTVFVKV